LVSLNEDVVLEDESNYRDSRKGMQMTLKHEFHWFLIEDFLRLKRGDTSVVDDEQDQSNEEKEKSPGRCGIQEDGKEIPPPRGALNNLMYDSIIHTTIVNGS